MNIETREVHLGRNDNGEREKNLKVYESFGWKYTRDGHRARSSSFQILARDMDMPNYRSIKALDDKYFALKAQRKVYTPIYEEPINFLIMFLLLLLFVIPLVLFLLIKSGQKEKVEEHNAELERQMDEILKEARSLL